jgi:arsenite-transporting ATPase
MHPPTAHPVLHRQGRRRQDLVACATAIALADAARVLLVSTDPASNLDEVLGVALGPSPTAIPAVPGLAALNIDPEQAAHAYRERVVGPYRGVLPAAALAAWRSNSRARAPSRSPPSTSSRSCSATPRRPPGSTTSSSTPRRPATRCAARAARRRGPASRPTTSAAPRASGRSPASRRSRRSTRASTPRCATRATTLVLVADPSARRSARPSAPAASWPRSASATSSLVDQRRVPRTRRRRPRSRWRWPPAARRARRDAAAAAALPRSRGAAAPLRPGRDRGAARDGRADRRRRAAPRPPTSILGFAGERLDALIARARAARHGVIMTMGKGGVGKTTVAARVASRAGPARPPVTLTTTDPAAHVEQAARELSGASAARWRSPASTRRSRPGATPPRCWRPPAPARRGRPGAAEEDLRSPCTEEIAVFRAFAETVAQGRDRFVVIDTAPTGPHAAPARRRRGVPSRGAAEAER